MVPLAHSAVRYWAVGAAPSSATEANCTQRVFVDGGSDHRAIHVHECVLAPLAAAQGYHYTVGDAASPENWSATFNFTTWADPVGELTLAVYGDMGVDNARSLPILQRDLAAGGFDAVLHVGDFAYNMDDDQGVKGDRFMDVRGGDGGCSLLLSFAFFAFI